MARFEAQVEQKLIVPRDMPFLNIVNKLVRFFVAIIIVRSLYLSLFSLVYWMVSLSELCLLVLLSYCFFFINVHLLL
jgi:hypothetical protein